MQFCGSLSILWHCLSLGLEWKRTFSSPVATAEFSKCAGILSAALSRFTSSEYELKLWHLSSLFTYLLTLCNFLIVRGFFSSVKKGSNIYFIELFLELKCTVPHASQMILNIAFLGRNVKIVGIFLNLKYWNSNTLAALYEELTHLKRPWCWERLRREKGRTEDEMAGWHHWLDGCESEWALGVGDGQGGLACSGSWGRKESDMTQRLKWTELIEYIRRIFY